MVDIALPEIDYTRYSNRQLAAVPLAVLGVALVIILGWYVVTGAPVSPGIEFTGGTEVEIATTDSPDQIRSTLEGFDIASLQPVAGSDSYVLTTQSTANELIRTELTEAGYEPRSFAGTSASFGAGAAQTTLLALGVAFLGMSILIFLLFRSFIPSIAVVASAFSDLVVPVAFMNVFGIRMTLGTVAALLMLIGYSVDSDVLLNNHILRRSGGFYESTYRAMRTGVTMTLTSISAMTVMAIVAYLFAIPLMPQIGLILVVGLATDLMNTYLLNLSLLRWYKYEGASR
ncbi:MAG: protein translocase subunit SecF [Haloarculaceae archaeon]